MESYLVRNKNKLVILLINNNKNMPVVSRTKKRPDSIYTRTRTRTANKTKSKRIESKRIEPKRIESKRIESKRTESNTCIDIISETKFDFIRLSNATHLLYNGIPISLKVEIKLRPYYRVNFVIGENCLTFYVVHPYNDDTKLEAHLDSLTPYKRDCDKRVIPAYYLDIVDRICVACGVFRCELLDSAKTHIIRKETKLEGYLEITDPLVVPLSALLKITKGSTYYERYGYVAQDVSLVSYTEQLLLQKVDRKKQNFASKIGLGKKFENYREFLQKCLERINLPISFDKQLIIANYIKEIPVPFIYEKIF